MNTPKCITFDQEAQNNLPDHIKAKMKADRDNARQNKKATVCPECNGKGYKTPDRIHSVNCSSCKGTGNK
jgi:DnaJ-class molecular chaperone